MKIFYNKLNRKECIFIFIFSFFIKQQLTKFDYICIHLTTLLSICLYLYLFIYIRISLYLLAYRLILEIGIYWKMYWQLSCQYISLISKVFFSVFGNHSSLCRYLYLLSIYPSVYIYVRDQFTYLSAFISIYKSKMCYKAKFIFFFMQINK